MDNKKEVILDGKKIVLESMNEEEMDDYALSNVDLDKTQDLSEIMESTSDDYE